MNKIIILLLLVSSPVSAGIYKWTDSNGNVHFGDKPVDNTGATEMNIKVNKNAGVTNSSGNKVDREYLIKKIDEKKQDDAEKRKEKRELNKKHKMLCNNYRVKYENQIRANSLFTMDANGERTYLSDKERAARKKMIQKGIKKYCH